MPRGRRPRPGASRFAGAAGAGRPDGAAQPLPPYALRAGARRAIGWAGPLIRRESRRDQPARFLQHLVARLLEAGGLPDGLPESTGALEELLYQALGRAGERLPGRPASERVVVILDGLDALAPEAD